MIPSIDREANLLSHVELVHVSTSSIDFYTFKGQYCSFLRLRPMCATAPFPLMFAYFPQLSLAILDFSLQIYFINSSDHRHLDRPLNLFKFVIISAIRKLRN